MTNSKRAAKDKAAEETLAEADRPDPEAVEASNEVGGDLTLESEQGEPVQPASPEQPTTAVVVRDRDQAVTVMDQYDAEQILDELQGRLLGTMLYKFPQGGQQIADLSYAGVLEIIRRLNAAGHQIRIAAEPGPELTEIVEEDETYYRAIVYALDERTGMGQFGLAKQAKHKTLRNGKKERDPFAETIALNKAQRNALRAFVPEEWRQTLIAQYTKDPQRVRTLQVEAGAGGGTELPPPLTSEEAEALREECRALYREICETPGGRVKFTPGKFNALLRQHEWDLKRLDEYRDHLAATLDGYQAEAGAAA